MTFLSQSTTKIYVSFHTHGPCFWLNGTRSLFFDNVLAACLTLATTSRAVALSCPTATLGRATKRRATARTTRILPFFIPVLLSRPGPTCPPASRAGQTCPDGRARLPSRLHRSSACARPGSARNRLHPPASLQHRPCTGKRRSERRVTRRWCGCEFPSKPGANLVHPPSGPLTVSPQIKAVETRCIMALKDAVRESAKITAPLPIYNGPCHGQSDCDCCQRHRPLHWVLPRGCDRVT